MIGLALYSDPMFKREQHQDRLREAEHYRLVKAAAQSSGSKPSQKAAKALRKPLIRLGRHLPGLRSISRARA
jgi:hypothetical protein